MFWCCKADCAHGRKAVQRSLARGVSQMSRWVSKPRNGVARLIDAQNLAERKCTILRLLILDVGTSLEFESAHVPGAKWISRGWIELKLPEQYS